MHRSFYKSFSLLLCVLLLLSGAAAAAAENTADVPEGIIDGILSYKMQEASASDLAQWADGGLAEGAGTTSEWYAIGLRQYKDTPSLRAYGENLEKFLQNGQIHSATAREKYILALLAAGYGNSPCIPTLLSEETVGAQGLMSWIYGLHVLTNGISVPGCTVEEAIGQILSAQLADGGWAVMGSTGDTDVTAMTLQALAPYCGQNEDIRQACEAALPLLSSRQQATGACLGFGQVNPETTAQVLTALCALNIDPLRDVRFIQGGKTLVDGLLIFRLKDGSFCHELGKGSDASATVQAFYSLVALWRQQQGLGSLYIFDTQDTPQLGEIVLPEKISSPAPVKLGSVTAPERTSILPAYMIWTLGILGLVVLFVCILLFLLKKRNIKNYLLVLLAGGLVCAFVLLTDFASAGSYYTPPAPKEDAVGSVTMTIRCDTVAGQKDTIPKDGVILPETEFDIRQGDTVFTILTEAARTYSIQIDNQGTSSGTHGMVYIAGINYLYEFDFGELSGWVYHVNGAAPNVGCGDYVLQDGDKIAWLYTCDLGHDVEE